METINGKEIRETAFNTHQGAEYVEIYTEQQKWITKIERYQEKHPHQVKIIHKNEDGSIIAHCPVSWMKLSPPRQVSEEQKEAARERFNNMWAKRNEE